MMNQLFQALSLSDLSHHFVDFFVEIFSEEIPARMQKKAVCDFESLFSQELASHGIMFKNTQTFITPQRMVFKADITTQTKSTLEEKRGPKTTAPDKALDGFLQSVGFNKHDLIVKDDYYYACIQSPSKTVQSILPDLLEMVLKKMQWPKVMRYPGSSIPWVRPIRHIICSYNSKPMIFDIPCVGLKTVSCTKGHRFLSPHNISITSFANYEADLEKAFVILDHTKRRALILQQLTTLADQKNLTLNLNEHLVDEVTGLCEMPITYVRPINNQFMELPACVLTTSMTYHQKYFSFFNEDGKLAPYFGVVVNNTPSSIEKMLKGYETVLTARLSDAVFFFETDVKTPLINLLPKLKNVLFQDKLGTVYDKVQRLLSYPGHDTALKQAIELSKSDLVTLMVGEFPELQGKMGHLYALQQGVDKNIATCIKEHYLPQGVKDDLPASLLAKKIAILDKMDSIVGLFGIGLKPTGSKDPFALRRQALAIIRILLTDDFLTFDLATLIHNSIHQYETSGIQLAKNTFDQVKTFILERFYHYMRELYTHDDIVAVTNILDRDHLTLALVSKRIAAFSTFSNTDQGEKIQQAYRRAKGVCTEKASRFVIESLFTVSEEEKLFASIKDLAKHVEPLLNQHDYSGAMIELAHLQQPINSFFENVMVNVEDQAIADNRKALLNMFTQEVRKIADF
jgi:glycyl-tRNA synthetase beta chain